MTLSRSAAYAIGTWFGAGRAPKAPGTVGSLGAIPLHWVACQLNPIAHLGLVLVTSAAGTWAAQQIADHEQLDDPQHVVIDEVAGTLIAMGLSRSCGPMSQLVAFALFRLFDIWKPGPIAAAERLKPKGLGIMADDLLAGVVAGALTKVIFRR